MQDVYNQRVMIDPRAAYKSLWFEPLDPESRESLSEQISLNSVTVPGYRLSGDTLICPGGNSIALNALTGVPEPKFGSGILGRKIALLEALRFGDRPLLRRHEASRLVKKIEGRVKKGHSGGDKLLFRFRKENGHLQVYILTRHLLGKGAYRAVYLAIKYESGADRKPKLVAASFSDDRDPIDENRIQLLKCALGKASIPHKIRSRSNCYIAPYANFGTFDTLRRERVSEAARKELFLGAAKALHRLHKESIALRDVKPDNLLIAKKGEDFQVFVTDLNCAARSDSPSEMGAPSYYPPELITSPLNLLAKGDKHDVFALGIVFWRALSQTFSEPGWLMASKCNGVITSFSLYQKNYHAWSSDEPLDAAHLLAREMMHPSMTSRIAMKEVIRRLEEIDPAAFLLKD